MERRRVGVIALLVGAVALAAVLVAVLRRPDDASPDLPPAGLGLLAWEPRGALHADAALLAETAAVWRAGVLAGGGEAQVPAGPVYELWAGTIGAGRLFLLQAVGVDGTPLVAQVSEHGDPAALALDAVEAIPADPPPALVATYDGNLDDPGLAAGANSGLLQLLEAPDPPDDARALWRQTGRTDGNELKLLELRDGSMTKTFLHIGTATEPPTRIVVGAVGVRAGIVTTVDVRPGHLVPERSDVQLADGPPWGPSGRIDGGEDVDARLAATGVYAHDATVREITSGTGEVHGDEFSARLLQVHAADDRDVLVLIARDEDGQVACMSSQPPSPRPAHPESPAVSIALVRCTAPAANLLVTVAAVPDGTGPIDLRGSSQAAAEPAERVVVFEPYVTGPRTATVATLHDDPQVFATLPPLAEPIP